MGLIDRENLINEMESHIYWGDSVVGLLEVAKAAPAIEAEPVRHGEWIDITHDHAWAKCSECGYCWKREMIVYLKIAYCPNCGAKMDGGERDAPL